MLLLPGDIRYTKTSARGAFTKVPIGDDRHFEETRKQDIP